MEQGKTGKIAALALAAGVTAAGFFGDCGMGVGAGCGLAPRVLHPFFHVGVAHAALNAWCLLSVAFVYGVTPRLLLLAWLSSALFPAAALGETAPVVGMSGMVFFLFASIFFRTARKKVYALWMAAYLAAGFVFPSVSGRLHLWCFALGFVYAVLNVPIRIKRKRVWG